MKNCSRYYPQHFLQKWVLYAIVQSLMNDDDDDDDVQWFNVHLKAD